MSFLAGSIVGSLGLNISEFSKGMIEAEGMSELFPEVVKAFLVNPLLGVMDAAKEAAAFITETVFEIGNAASQAGLDAQKAGVGVEFFSQYAAVGKTVNVSNEQLVQGFKFLQRSMVDAVGGTNQLALRGFGSLGISTDFLKGHLNDVQGAMSLVHEKLMQIPEAALRTRIGMEIMGRGGADLLPILAMQGEHFQEIIDRARSLGAIETEESAKQGQRFRELEATLGFAWEGIKKKLAEPILAGIEAHLPQINALVDQVSDQVRSAIGDLFDYLNSDEGRKSIDAWFAALKVDIPEIVRDVREVGEELKPLLYIIEKIIQATSKLHELGLLHVLNPLGQYTDLASSLGIGGFGGGGDSGSNPVIVQAQFTVPKIDDLPHAASSQFAAVLQPQMKELHHKIKRSLVGAARSQRIAKHTGGVAR